MKKIITIITIIIFPLILFTVYRLDNLSIKASVIKDIEFNHLAGSLYLPDHKGPYNVIIFVHGDGPADRTLDGGYNLIINRLTNAGYACFSYDKAGIAQSKGNWLNQTMRDRAKQVQQAIKAIKAEIQVKAIGTLAFSQGGWVTSELALLETPLDFNIVIGGAIDWQQQHIYYETEYAKSAGFTKDQIADYLEYIKKSDAFIFANDYNGYLSYVQGHHYESPMTEERFNFVYLNHASNAEAGIKAIKAPFLGVFGDSDKNVNVLNTIEVYKEIFKSIKKTDYQLYLVKDANHELLNSKYNQEKNAIALYTFLYGEAIFADGALDLIVDWLNKTLYED